MTIDKSLLKEIALSFSEYEKIIELLGRKPTTLELGLFGALWSEHCGYKHTKLLLKTLPNKSSRVISNLGSENAGVIDLGNGLKAVMKVESHNHPSAIEPKEGAATGVGGIVRDIFAMGAFPIALLNSLRFGPLDEPRNRYLFDGVIEGISSYGNCLGIPDIGGEIEFEDCYSKNPLVNAMCVGIVRDSPLMSAKAEKEGNVLILVGAETGKDGIHGASGLASQSIEESSSARSAVQVGNPFLEKVLLEACLISVKMKGIVGMQDLGAAGLTSSVIEVAYKSNLGVNINLDKVHLKEEDMTAYEIMLSESQERMLIISEEKHAKKFIDFFNTRDLTASIIGHFNNSKNVTIMHKNQQILKTPVKILTEAPSYELNEVKPSWIEEVQEYKSPSSTKNLQDIFEGLLNSPNIASKKEIFQQYDHQVQLNTIVGPGKADAAILRLKKNKEAIALTIDCDSKKCFLDPEVGAAMAVAESCRNIVCTGATPLALTDGLNLGNPEKIDVQYQISKTIKGIKLACDTLGIPIISGNVSLYNEADEKPIYPTPTIGAIGFIDNYDNALTSGFKNEGDHIIILGSDPLDDSDELLSGSEYQKLFEPNLSGMPKLDLNLEKSLHLLMIEMTKKRLLQSAHDCSTGGIAIAIAESCILGSKGAEIKIGFQNKKAALFGENRSAIIISCYSSNVESISLTCKEYNVGFLNVGTVQKGTLEINEDIKITVEKLKSIFYPKPEKIN
ncbi:MAG: phosphoribosylformylglycinamidine synthase subunit PurL [Chloroflexota bacterium]